MDWTHPEALYLILPLGLAWLGLVLHARSRTRRAAEQFVGTPLWPRLLPAPSPARFWIKTALWGMALVLGIVALAGPSFGTYYETIRPRGSDLYVLMDVSRSMLAEDVPPSRLGRAKADVSGLLNQLRGERVGVIAFAGKAVVRCPLTTDYAYVRQALNELDPNSAPRGGTCIGDAIRKALDVMPQESDRDQSILLITDGGDQDSQPLKAAAVAAERRVMIFTVGLGDTAQGARIPVEKYGEKRFVAYNGQEVWSKLDGTLLGQIALSTNATYVPAGTKAYDLGELYKERLQALRAGQKEQQRKRQSQQFQIFLALAVACLLIELLIHPHRLPEKNAQAAARTQAEKAPSAAALWAALLLSFASGSLHAADAGQLVREGLDLYAKEKFAEAKEKFAQANEMVTKENAPPEAAVAAFDLGCAYQRQGEFDKARDSYLKAALSRDRKLITDAHFNLGCAASEAARKLAGEKPETVPPGKRQELIDKLKEAIGAFRHTLDLKPDHAGAQKNLELTRLWIKYYTGRWHALDRERIRREMNLVNYLEHLMQSQRALRYSVKDLTPASPLDYFYEHKQAQTELAEEIDPLKDKIKDTFNPAAPPSGQAAQPAQTADPKAKEQLEKDIKTLQGMADAAGRKMTTAIDRLAGRQPEAAAAEEQQAERELEKIWLAIVPFHPLLARELADQTGIVRTLKPESENAPPAQEKWQGALFNKLMTAGKDVFNRFLSAPKKAEANAKEKALSASPAPSAPVQPALRVLKDEEFKELAEFQHQTLERSALLKRKAEMELKQFEEQHAKAPSAPASNPQTAPAPGHPAQPDPGKVKEGYRKAIELAPQAVDKMSASERCLAEKNSAAAHPEAEEARRILDEIAQAQPKNDEQKQDQKENKDEQKKDQSKQGQEQAKQDQKKDEQKDSQQEKDDKQSISQDQLQEILRRVCEREKKKHEKDREIRGRLGSEQAEKDW